MNKRVFSILLIPFFSIANETKWELSNSSSKMSNDSIISATIESDNEVEFDFPYEGKQRAKLSLWTTTNSNTDYLTFSIERGQIVCGFGKGCSVDIKVDDEDAVSVKGTPPSDGTSTYITVDLDAGLAAKLKRAKKILAQPTIFQNGYPVFEFDAKNNPYPCCKQYPIWSEIDNIKNGTLPELIEVGSNTEKKPMNICKLLIPSSIQDKNFGFGEYGVYTKKETKSSIEWIKYGFLNVEKNVCKNGTMTTTKFKYKNMSIN